MQEILMPPSAPVGIARVGQAMDLVFGAFILIGANDRECGIMRQGCQPQPSRSPQEGFHMAYRAIPLVMALLLMLTLLGCEGGGPVPVDPAATATAQVADQATLTARQGLVGTYGANANVTATAGAVVLARVRPLIGLDLQDAGPIILAGTTFQAVRLTITNRDSAPHHLVIRLYERTAPLNIRAYAS